MTHNDDGTLRPWYRDIAALTERRGVDVFFDPVAAGRYVEYEIRCLARGGTIWLYGLLDAPGVVDLTPLIRKRGVNADVYLIDVDKVIRGLAPDKNYALENGDVIVVPKRKGTNWLQWTQQLLSIYGLVNIFR